MNSEAVYLFRHLLLREAAYQVQLPSHRARLHRIAFAVIEDLAGGPPPDLSARDAAYAYTVPPHPADPFAAELEEHARLCSDTARHRRYLARAAAHASRSFQNDLASRLWKRFAALVEGAERVAALRNAAAAARNAGRPADAERTFEEALQACSG
ncbi:MAG: hypothetical protein K8T20_12435, partial [Planctomycetes bacterium]|nr:hypothetical protein [Planctomycetota bacterium]